MDKAEINKLVESLNDDAVLAGINMNDYLDIMETKYLVDSED